MGLMNKVKFWKHDDLDLESELPPLDDEASPSYQPQFDFNREFEKPSMPQQPMMQQGRSQDMELISAKLDAIKSELDSISMRLKKIESIADDEKKSEGKFSKDPWTKY